MYTRDGNPNRVQLESQLAGLEQAQFCSVFATGMAVVTSISHLISAGDHVICGDNLYGGTTAFFRDFAPGHGIDVSFVNPLDPANIESAIKRRPKTRMVILESPSNPTLTIVDIRAVSAILAKQPNKILFVFDNTFATPLFMKPLAMGVDIVYHSLTKYINGHDDLSVGAAMTNDPKIDSKLKSAQKTLGTVPSPFDCYMVSRGLQTFELRMERHHQNGLEVARFLEGHRKVRQVLHPGLESHPQYQLALSQCSGFSGMIAFYLDIDLTMDKSTIVSILTTFYSSLKFVAHASSLGGTRSNVCSPRVATHADLSDEHATKVGIDLSLIRASVGIERAADIIADFNQALNKLP